MRIHPVRKTQDRKVGNKAAVTYSSWETCPPSCSRYESSDCYARGGRVRLHADAVTRGDTGMTVRQAAKQIEAWKPQYWRHNVAGDLPGKGETIDPVGLLQLDAAAGACGTAWTYTHKHQDLEALRACRHLVVNLSADSVSQAVELVRTGLPVVIASPELEGDLVPPPRYIAGKRVVTCPADITHGRGEKSVTCTGGAYSTTLDGKKVRYSCSVACGGGNPLCARRNRDFIVRFLEK